MRDEITRVDNEVGDAFFLSKRDARGGGSLQLFARQLAGQGEFDDVQVIDEFGLPTQCGASESRAAPHSG